MLKKIFLIFAFLFIAQAIAYCLPGDTVWAKNNVNALITKFSITVDYIICFSFSDSNRIQIRYKATGKI